MAGHVPHEYPELVCAGGYVRHVTELINVGFRAERAVSPCDGGVWWVVLDAELVVHREASAFLACLQGADRSVAVKSTETVDLTGMAVERAG